MRFKQDGGSWNQFSPPGNSVFTDHSITNKLIGFTWIAQDYTAPVTAGAENIREILFIEDTESCEYSTFTDPSTVTLSMTVIAGSVTPVTEDLSTVITRTSTRGYDDTACTYTLTLSPVSISSILTVDASNVLTLQNTSPSDKGILTVTLQTVVPPSQATHLLATPSYLLTVEIVCQVATLSVDSVPADFVMTYESGPQITPDQVTTSLAPVECNDNPISLTSFVARKFGVIDSATFITLGTLPPQPLNISPTMPT